MGFTDLLGQQEERSRRVRREPTTCALHHDRCLEICLVPTLARLAAEGMPPRSDAYIVIEETARSPLYRRVADQIPAWAKRDKCPVADVRCMPARRSVRYSSPSTPSRRAPPFEARASGTSVLPGRVVTKQLSVQQ